ncbi:MULTISPECIES: DUF4398 domain-containing protein [unclassified Pseudomonas]|uniref:DUF4398 domain-containing protein n=1 Tax=unclassified Pseudomonas TaxID=196821 RepID=UPI000BD0DCBA|nr:MULTISPECIES: DUF4398 domain-containing protein [unclassified Pseudomonas]PVZ20310.1 uncharacterized protein DUF4398 [Pseudomonas sp. URIL14HWK12:I12]PVZ27376.1 uncharacterized protein DUF4398 [Pseudomonas sp. URIL14HWK12:I10]PVZ38265.1 uncharacterized protein DUF4398 [Pseudomonas sp. URIL14HWK12:I11]SNZ04045.1 protein of unknown function [Pseudomonas sp. URIL14HWK12:I9]
MRVNSKRSTLLLLMALAGCSSDPVPTEQLRVTDEAIAQATASGAQDQPELAQAREHAAQARAELASGRNKPARQAAEQAELDARLAEALVLQAQQQARTAQLQVRIKRLREQLEGQ